MPLRGGGRRVKGLPIRKKKKNLELLFNFFVPTAIKLEGGGGEGIKALMTLPLKKYSFCGYLKTMKKTVFLSFV